VEEDEDSVSADASSIDDDVTAERIGRVEFIDDAEFERVTMMLQARLRRSEIQCIRRHRKDEEVT
jgi:hypothetical protein